MSGGRASELSKQTKGSQSSLDQLEQDSKVRESPVCSRSDTVLPLTLVSSCSAGSGERGAGEGAGPAG